MGWNKPPGSAITAQAQKPGRRWDSPVVVRYADDQVALCASREQAEQVKARLAEWLKPRGVGLQRGQDEDRPPRRRFRLFGVQRPPLPGKAADQTVEGGVASAPGTAHRGDESPARGQRLGGDPETEPDHPGMVDLLPGGGFQRGVLQAGHACVEAHLQVGTPQPPEQIEGLDSKPVLRCVQQVPA